MRKIFAQKHVELLSEFIKAHVPSIIVEDLALERQARKILILMDSSQLEMLEHFAALGKFTEKEIELQLGKFGFVPKTNLFEKKAMLGDIMKRKLMREVTQNHELIDYDKLKSYPDDGKTDSELVSYLFKQLYVHHSKSKTLTEGYYYVPEFEVDGEELIEKTESKPKMGPEADLVPVPDDQEPRPRRQRKMPYYEEQSKAPAVPDETVLNDPNVVLRKKKAMYYEPSGPIEYRSDKRLKMNSVSKALRRVKIPELKEIWKSFDLRSFVDEILFVNNNIEIPKVSKYGSLAEFKRHMKGFNYFKPRFLTRLLTEMILKQDETLSLKDADVLAKEIRPYLTLPELEYCYKRYLLSEEFQLDPPKRGYKARRR